MKSIKNITLIIAVLTVFSSCDDFLIKEPYTLTPETYFNTESELLTFLTGVYSPVSQEHFYGNEYIMKTGGGDDLSFYQRSTPINAIICNNVNSSDNSILGFWRLLYDGINRANILLENVDKNTAIAQNTRDRIRAEALFLRSFYYFNLVQAWGDVPLRLSAITSPENLDLERTPKQLVYNQIIKDIKATIPYLYKSTDLAHTGRVTQSAAKGILARIYLFRAGENYRDIAVGNPVTNSADSIMAYFTHARDLALEVKNSGIHSLSDTYSSIFVDMAQDKYNTDGRYESIWEAEQSGNRTTPDQASGRAGNMFGFGANQDYSTNSTFAGLKGMANPGYSYGFLFASLKLYNMYEAEGDTMRSNWNIAPYNYTYASTSPRQVIGRSYFYGKKPANLTSVEGFPVTEMSDIASSSKTRCSAKYRRELELVTPKTKNYTPINIPIIHYSDILLMLAEAENEINDFPSALAYECIDAVRNRAMIFPMTGSGLSKEDFRQFVKNERAMELCFEGIRRWDLIRWGDYHTAMNSMQQYVDDPSWNSSHKYAGQYYKVSVFYNYFPIPDAEISVNKLIIRNNPGW